MDSGTEVLIHLTCYHFGTFYTTLQDLSVSKFIIVYHIFMVREEPRVLLIFSSAVLLFYLMKELEFRTSIARLSFALSASKIKEKARVVAMDLRGHGKSSTDNELDLSIEVHA